MKSVVLFGTIALFCGLTWPGSIQAQTNGVSITGWVMSRSGSGLAGATVIARNRSTGFVATVDADISGRFSFSDLPDGSYSVSAIASSFDEPRIQRTQVMPQSVLAALRAKFEAPEKGRDIKEPQLVPTPDKGGPRRPIVIKPRGNYL